MSAILNLRGFNLAPAIFAAVAGTAVPALAEPYLFSPSPRAPLASSQNARPAGQLPSAGSQRSPYGRTAKQIASPFASRAPPRPRSVCRRLIRDPRYGYVEVQFAC